MILGCMSFNEHKEKAISNLTINAHVDIEFLDNVLIPWIENWFGDNEIIFQNNNASCHKGVKAFLLERNRKINDTTSEPPGSKSY